MTPDRIENARILIVDDHEPNVRLLGQILRRAGFTNLEMASNGREALSAIATAEPDLVLLDLHLPDVDGFAVLDAIGADGGIGRLGQYLPVLVLTADSTAEARDRALSHGAKDFLTKPFDATEVTLRTRNLIETRLLHQALRLRNAELAADIQSVSRQLADAEAGWASVATSLRRLAPAGSAEATADAICAELAGLSDLAISAILVFEAGDVVVPIAGRATVDLPTDARGPLPAARARRLREHAARGSWIEPWSLRKEDRAFGQWIGQHDVNAVAYVPFGIADTPVGVLAVGAGGEDGVARLAHRLSSLEAFGAIAGALVGPTLSDRNRDERRRSLIAAVIAKGAFRPVFQPIVRLDTRALVGYEALTRFADATPPDRRFADAIAVGLGLELEFATLQAAVAGATGLASGVWLSLNVSPELVLDGARLSPILKRSATPIVLEITEHIPVIDYGALRDAIARLGPTFRFAIDDAGAGFSSFRHIVELGPQFVKLDSGLVRAIEADRARQAFVAGMVYFSDRTGCSLIAEGIETEAELKFLGELGVDLGQGYLPGRPSPSQALVGVADAHSTSRRPCCTPDRCRRRDQSRHLPTKAAEHDRIARRAPGTLTRQR